MILREGSIYKTKESCEFLVLLDGTAFLTSIAVKVDAGLCFKYIRPLYESNEFMPVGKDHPNYPGRYHVHSWCILIDDDKLPYLVEVPS